MKRKIIKETTPIGVRETAPKVETAKDVATSMEYYNGFARSLFGENFEPGTVKVKRGQPDPKKITMLQVEREFMLTQQARNNTDRTVQTYKQHFNRLFRFLGFQYLKQSKVVLDDAVDNFDKYGSVEQIGASMPVLVLELDNFAAYYQDYLKNNRKVSEQTIISSLRNLRAITYFAQERKWIKEFGMKVKEVPPDIKPVFTKYEIAKLSRKPKLNQGSFVEYRSWVMIQYLAATGNRVSSMLALNVGDIDFDSGAITVNVQKNRKPKLMPLVSDMRRILREYISLARSDEDGIPLYSAPLFCTRTGDRLSYEGARDAMQDYFTARGIEWQGFHKFRYSYAANWIRDGGSESMLKEQLGHTSLAMTYRYARVYGMETKDEAEEHSLIKKFPNKTGRKSIRLRKR